MGWLFIMLLILTACVIISGIGVLFLLIYSLL